MKETSYVNVYFKYEGDPMDFWAFLKSLKNISSENKVEMTCDEVTTIKEE